MSTRPSTIYQPDRSSYTNQTDHHISSWPITIYHLDRSQYFILTDHHISSRPIIIRQPYWSPYINKKETHHHMWTIPINEFEWTLCFIWCCLNRCRFISWYHYILLLEVYIKFSTSTQTFYTRTSANECNALSTSRINTLGSNVEDRSPSVEKSPSEEIW